MARNSFYRRELPKTCVWLSSKEGRDIFKSALDQGGLKSFFPLIEQHVTQAEPSYCGLSTLIVILNALAVDPKRRWKGGWRWYDETMLNCCVELEEVKRKGITFQTFTCLAKCQGLDVRTKYASESSLEEFRDVVLLTCKDDSSAQMNDVFLVVSYSRKVIGQTGSGHFAPVAGYDPKSNSILILDTARFKYGSHWVPLPLIFEAMQPIDVDTNKSRGFVLLSVSKELECSFLPTSILFKIQQSSVWLQYRAFMEEHTPITLEEVISFWKSQDLFEILIPKLVSTHNSLSQTNEVIELLKVFCQKYPSLISLNEKNINCTCCSSRHCTSKSNPCIIPIDFVESIFVIYLASLPVSLRSEVLYDASITGTAGTNNDVTREQILRESQLIRYAIDFSTAE